MTVIHDTCDECGKALKGASFGSGESLSPGYKRLCRECYAKAQKGVNKA